MTARPFDLKSALSGEPVTFEGTSRTYTFSRFDKDDGHPLIFANEDGFFTSTLDGIAGGGQIVTMAPRKTRKTVWVSIAVSPFHRPDCPPAISAHAYWNQDAAGEGAVPVEIEVAE